MSDTSEEESNSRQSEMSDPVTEEDTRMSDTSGEESSSRQSEVPDSLTEENTRMSDTSEEESNSRQSEVSDSVTEEDTRNSMVPTEEERNLKHVFLTPAYLEPKHPILSSPYCRHIAAMAYGPTKPPWYQALASSQLYLFRDIINYVTVGRSGYFHFDRFLEALQDFDPTITKAEVLGILDSMEKSPFEELDLGKFLFLLAYNEEIEESENTEDSLEKLSSPTVTARQCLILSAISYFVLITTRFDIERYYYANTRRKATVLHYHMESARLGGISEEAMEIKQKKAAKNLGPLYRFTSSPYTMPVPFVPSFRKGPIYRDWKAKYGSKSHTIPKLKRGPTAHIKTHRELGDKLINQTEREKITRSMIYGNIPLPEMRFPHKIIERVREKGFTVQMKNYLMRKAEEARNEYRKLLKDVGVICGEHYLRPILNQGFPTHKDSGNFMEVYQRYFPLDVNDWQNFSLWVKPIDFTVGNHRGPLYPEKIAFGKTFK